MELSCMAPPPRTKNTLNEFADTGKGYRAKIQKMGPAPCTGQR